MKKFTTIRRWLKIAIVAELIVLLCLSGVVYAKYTTDKTLTGSVTINAELGTIQILEHEAQKQPDGSYKLIGVTADGKCDPNAAHTHMDGSSEKKGNIYTHVIPGLDIPKDPYVVIKDKTTIPAYVFVEVKDTLPSNSQIIYTIDEVSVSNPNGNWYNLGKLRTNGGTVYVYTGGTGHPLAITDQTPNLDKITILIDNTVHVSQNLKEMGENFICSISFTASMGQVGKNGDGTTMTPNDVYSFITSGT